MPPYPPKVLAPSARVGQIYVLPPKFLSPYAYANDKAYLTPPPPPPPPPFYQSFEKTYSVFI